MAVAVGLGTNGGGLLLDDPPRYLAGLNPRTTSGPEPSPLPSEAEVKGQHQRLLTVERPLRYLTVERGLSLNSIRRARIGWNGRRLVFPVYRRGELVAYKTRAPREGANMKNCAGKGRPWPLYPEPEASWRWALLVAGELDALRGLSAGLPTCSVTLGAGTWRDEWFDDLAQLRGVVVCFDNNEQDQARATVSRLREAGVPSRRRSLRRLGLTTPKGDLSDYLNGGGEPGTVRRAARKAR